MTRKGYLDLPGAFLPPLEVVDFLDGYPQRLIKQYHVTNEGEFAIKVALAIDEKKIQDEAAYYEFYVLCTNLEDDAAEIARINKRRWRVEECFRMMKSDLKARPVYLKWDGHIKAHFLTCFMALAIYRILEKKLDHEFSKYGLDVVK